MSVKSTAVTVAVTATVLATADQDRDGMKVKVQVPAAGQTVYLGGADVSVANGFAVATGAESHELTLSRGEILYGIVNATTQAVRVIKTSSL